MTDRLIKVSEYRRRKYGERGGLCVNTIKKLIAEGKINGIQCKLTGMWFVYESECESTGNDLADKILRESKAA